MHSGRVKLRVVHAAIGTVFLPDLIVLDGSPATWVQPEWVYPPQLSLGPSSSAQFHFTPTSRTSIDILLGVHFTASDFVTELADGSHIYECQVTGELERIDITAGRARIRDDGGVDIRAFHHTTQENQLLILESHEVWGSSWNFQGTRKLENISYAYFTHLPQISDEMDLNRIGMSARGQLHFRLDEPFGSGGADLILDVYRDSPGARTASVPLWIPAELIAPQHVRRHSGRVVEYEMAHPWIMRVGLVPQGKLRFTGDEVDREQPDAKAFDYVILGDCTELDGLRAPYEEENTSQTFRFAKLDGRDLFSYWIANSNKALFEPPDDFQRLVDH